MPITDYQEEKSEKNAKSDREPQLNFRATS